MEVLQSKWNWVDFDPHNFGGTKFGLLLRRTLCMEAKLSVAAVLAGPFNWKDKHEGG